MYWRCFAWGAGVLVECYGNRVQHVAIKSDTTPFALMRTLKRMQQKEQAA